MKRKIIFSVLFLLCFLITGVYAGTISGFVKNSTTQAPIANQYVVLYGDSINTYNDSTLTNSSGYYIFQNVPAIPLFSHYYVKVWDCNQSQVVHQIDSLSAVSDFYICQNIPCQANFYSIVDTLNNKKFYFFNTSTGSPTTYSWNFGDNSTSSLQNPTHTYANNGSYMVTLTISGNSCTSTKYDTITAGPGCQSNFNYQISPTNPLLVNFTNLSSAGLTSFFWNFGDNMTSNFQNPTHTYSQAGTYTVNLYAYNSTCSSNFSLSVTVVNIPCQAIIQTLQDSINPLKFYFYNASTGNPTSFLWSFGDGTSSMLQNVSHTFSSFGSYIVQLSISGTNCNSTAFDTVVINSPCQAAFADSIDATNPLKVYFVDLSVGNPSFWNWDFGDGITSTLQNPSHIFSQSGSYTVNLRITSSNCFDSTIHIITVNSPSGSLVIFAFADTMNLNSGTAFLYSYNSSNQSITKVDSANSTLYQGHNIFNFPHISLGDYKIQLIPPSNSPIFNTFYNTWFGNTFSWQNSDTIHIQAGSYVKAISLVKNSVILPQGSGYISGNISRFITSGNIPENNVDVFLLKNDSSIITKTQTDSSGNFMFPNLPFGNYLIFPELTGIKTLPSEVSLNSSNPSKEGIQFVIKSEVISTSIEPLILSDDEIKIYPNPAEDFVILHLETSSELKGKLEIIDISGRILQSSGIEFYNNNSYEMDISSFPKGIYLLRFLNDKQTFSKKIIKL